MTNLFCGEVRVFTLFFSTQHSCRNLVVVLVFCIHDVSFLWGECIFLVLFHTTQLSKHCSGVGFCWFFVSTTCPFCGVSVFFLFFTTQFIHQNTSGVVGVWFFLSMTSLFWEVRVVSLFVRTLVVLLFFVSMWLGGEGGLPVLYHRAH